MNQSPRELAAQKAQLYREQKLFLQDLLGIVDALDQACAHWQMAEQKQAPSGAWPPPKPTSHSPRWRLWLQHLWQCLLRLLGKWPAPPAQTESESQREVLVSAREGVEMIRQELLEVLNQRQVVPLESVGQTFDPQWMYAVGRQESEEAEENTVVQEVLPGYLWQNKILREAQVIVAVKSSASSQRRDSTK